MNPLAALGRRPMYRIVTVALIVVVTNALVIAAMGIFADPLTLENLVPSLAVCLAVSLVVNQVCGMVVRRKVHHESAVITALIVFLLFWPPTTALGYGWLVLALVVAQVSKYVIVWRGRHILNPAAAGALGAAAVQYAAGVAPQDTLMASWWVASSVLFWSILIGGSIVAVRTQMVGPVVVLVLVAGGMLATAEVNRGAESFDAIRTVAYSFPVLFLALYMFTEPLTLPARRRAHYAVALVMAMAMAGPQFASILVNVSLPPLLQRWEFAVVLGNLMAFAVARRSGIEFTLVENRAESATTRALLFRPKRPVAWRAGQYLELDVPHTGADRRGTRRMLSIASAPSDDLLRVAVKVPDSCSSFKRALCDLREGGAVHATGVWGDFLLPADDAKPLLLVAGGIGITPFAAQAHELADRDAVLVYGVPTGDDAPYIEEFSGTRGILVSPESPESLPTGWTHVAGTVITTDLLADHIPDLADRHAMISGPPVMVSAIRTSLFGPRWTLGLRRRVRSVVTDAFSGY